MILTTRPQWVNPSGAETRIFWENKANTMDDDALAPCVARPSAAMVSNMKDKSPLSSSRKDFTYLLQHNVEKWQEIQLCAYVSKNKPSTTWVNGACIAQGGLSH